MATRGNSAQIIVGAAQLYVKKAGAVDAEASNGGIPAFTAGTDYNTTVAADTAWRGVGYTSNGLELSFEPDFGEVKVDQLLDVAKLFKQGMKVSMKTSFAEATLENLLLAIAATNAVADHAEGSTPATVGSSLELISGELGEYPVERGLIAIGASVDPTQVKDADGVVVDEAATAAQRVYVAYRALSIESVNVAAKRDEATMFEVNFRLLPDDQGAYGKIIDRTF